MYTYRGTRIRIRVAVSSQCAAPLTPHVGNVVGGMAGAEPPTRAQLEEASRALVKEVQIHAISIQAFRHRLAAHFGLQPDGLDDRRDEVREVARSVLEGLGPEAGAAAAPGPAGPDWDEPENPKARQWVYLVTLAATLPETAEAAAGGGGVPLRTLDGLSREQIRDAVLDAVRNPVESRRVRPPWGEDAQEGNACSFSLRQLFCKG